MLSHPEDHVKQEIGTPLQVDDAGDTTTDEGIGERLRVSLRHPPAEIRVAKRKRHESIEPLHTPREPSGPPTHVLWTRSFPKISSSVLESISSHRNASTFSLPVKDKDAPGYSNLILRPQDLKSIRSAIHAGNRAAMAAATEDLSQSHSHVWLPISEELIPPKGIINYGQLEKELMRTFANAIMFNADPDRGVGTTFDRRNKIEHKGGEGYEIDEDSVVKDTRNMFAEIEKLIGDLRGMERASEEQAEKSEKEPEEKQKGTEFEDDVDELALATDDGSMAHGGTVKRRRRA